MVSAPDVTIVGGGPAGSALAIVLGQRGVRVVLYEKARHPRFKPCGEGLLPHGVRALRDIAGLPDGPRLAGLRFQAGDVVRDVPFPDDLGLVVRRDRFDAWLFERAADTPGVDARPGTPYRPGPTDLLVGADGVRSRFHRRLGVVPRRTRRVGFSTHVTGLEGLRDRVEIYFRDEGELYLAPTGGGEALVSVLVDGARADPDLPRRWLTETPALRARLSQLRFTSPVLASAPLGLTVPRIVSEDGERVLLVGDAAGTPDPIAAGGLALALSATPLAAEAVVSGDLRRYQRQRRRLGRRAARVSGAMLALARHEARAARVLRHGRWVLPALVAAAVGDRSRRAGDPLATGS